MAWEPQAAISLPRTYPRTSDTLSQPTYSRLVSPIIRKSVTLIEHRKLVPALKSPLSKMSYNIFNGESMGLLFWVELRRNTHKKNVTKLLRNKIYLSLPSPYNNDRMLWDRWCMWKRWWLRGWCGTVETGGYCWIFQITLHVVDGSQAGKSWNYVLCGRAKQLVVWDWEVTGRCHFL